MEILDPLNSQQRKAVTAAPGPVLVLAGPGSGKTRVLTHRIAYLVRHHEVRPDSILAVTFTNKAAREMQSRLTGLLAGPGVPAGSSHLWLGTFHAFAARLLRREADRLPVDREFVIFDDSDQSSAIRQAIRDLNLDPKQLQPNKVHAAISSAKNELIDWRDYPPETYFGEMVRRVYERYQALLIANNAVDFDDLLFYAVRLLRQDEAARNAYQSRYAHLLVDEFQDTNMAQYTLLRMLAPTDPDLFVVGDADQSIYRWRGADHRNVRRFQRDYPQAQVIVLEQSYRSTQTILDAATAVIDRLPGRQPKRLFTERGQGPSIRVHEAYDEGDEARFVVDTIAELTARDQAQPGECAVMYRINAQSRALEEAFLHAGLPYRLVGAQRFYGRREVRDIIGYLRLIHNPKDRVSLQRVINTPPRGIGDKTWAALLDLAAQIDRTPGESLLMLAETDSELSGILPSRSASALIEFGRMLRAWRDLAASQPLVSVIDRVLADVDYRRSLEDGSDQGQERWENILEVRAVAQEFADVGLTTFLEHVALVSDQDSLTENMNAPVLLTLHAAKGLEFPVVFIVGLDEGVFPHQRSFGDAEEMAEERRLFYVGVTRAKDRLHLVHAFRRRQFGMAPVSEPSRFLYDIPVELTEGNWAGQAAPDQAVFRRQVTWEQTPEPPEPRYRAGMRVQHPSFGEGIVLESHVDHSDEEVVVAFEDAGIKHLVASLARLEIQAERG